MADDDGNNDVQPSPPPLSTRQQQQPVPPPLPPHRPAPLLGGAAFAVTTAAAATVGPTINFAAVPGPTTAIPDDIPTPRPNLESQRKQHPSPPPAAAPTLATPAGAVATSHAPPHLTTPFGPLPSSTFSGPNIVLLVVLVFLAQARVGVWAIVLVGGVGLWAVAQAEAEATAARQAEEEMHRLLEEDDQHLVPHFVNHTLAKLWPLVSEELFTPIVDLLEDALQAECPAVVHSVRIDTLSQGTTPLFVKRLRPLSDREWFAGLQTEEEARDLAGMSGENGEDGARRRERETMLDERLEMDEDGEKRKESQIEGGEYANFEITFELTDRARRPADKAGLLIFFGVGLKGIGGVEMPVWVNLRQVTGIMRLRILLDPSPPFCRTGTFTFPTLPLIDIAALPLKRHGLGALNAMKIPGLKSYVLGCIRRVAIDFVAPRAYTMDLDRILTGTEGTFRTKNIGVLEVTVHSAKGLRAADRGGLSDPYVAISWWKQLKKPLFSTRVLIKNLNPVWEETAFILVPGDAVETGEKLCLQVYDSDRFNPDDHLGVVECDLAELVAQGKELSAAASALDSSCRAGTGDNLHARRKLEERVDALKPEKARHRDRDLGTLSWSVRFFPLSTVSSGVPEAEEVDRMEREREEKASEKARQNTTWPIWHSVVKSVTSEVEPFKWEKERLERRKESVKWMTGQRRREMRESEEKPSTARKSGLLVWNILQCQDLQVRAVVGELNNTHKNADAGIPAMAGQTAMLEGQDDEEEPVSTYIEVVLNDRLVFRTRTKKFNNSPYVNAAAERFVRDWSMEKVTFVVREQRDREHDPIIGIVHFDTLGDAFQDGSQVTRWYPISGGVGDGIMRLSLLWKPIDIDLPRGVSGFDLVTAQVHSLRVVNLSSLVSSLVPTTSVSLETESDVRLVGEKAGSADLVSSPQPSTDVFDRDDDDTASFVSGIHPTDLTWPFAEGEHISLAARYRLSTLLVIRFFTRTGTIKKRRTVWGIALVKLADVPDAERIEVGVPIYATEDLNEAMAWSFCQGGRAENTAQSKEVGSVELGLYIKPGIGKAHAKFLKSDKRLAAAEEVNRVTNETRRLGRSNAGKVGGESMSPDNGRPQSQCSSSDRPLSGASFSDMGSIYPVSSRQDDMAEDEEDEKSGWIRKWKKRSARDKTYSEGIHSHKSVRSAQWASDRIKGKLSGLTVPSGYSRREGAQHFVEQEGISSFR